MSNTSKRDTAGHLRVLGYVRVSSQEQAASGAGLSAQRSAIEDACQQRGFELVDIFEDAGWSAKDLQRPAITEALALLDAGKFDALVVAKVDRLARSVIDFCTIMDRSKRKGWALVALDLGVDTTTAAGQLVANIMASFAEFERKLIGERTRDALAAKKAAGVVLGRPRNLPDATVDRIVRERRAGATLDAIARRLNDGGVPTSQGGARWYGSSISAVLRYAAPPDAAA